MSLLTSSIPILTKVFETLMLKKTENSKENEFLELAKMNILLDIKGVLELCDILRSKHQNSERNAHFIAALSLVRLEVVLQFSASSEFIWYHHKIGKRLELDQEIDKTDIKELYPSTLLDLLVSFQSKISTLKIIAAGGYGVEDGFRMEKRIQNIHRMGRDIYERIQKLK
ncbi:hypothetical protein OAA91_00630 [Fibrobacterales bacterium]|nr:hypothetical protein [Fibrobacterales bacterium]